MKLLDAGEQGERDWVVVKRDDHNRDPAYNMPFNTTNVVVRAASMEIVDGALVFRTAGGELSWAFGPGGWLEVSRA